MDKEEKDFSENEDGGILSGQMCYDELSPVEKEEITEDYRDIILNGQMGFGDIEIPEKLEIRKQEKKLKQKNNEMQTRMEMVDGIVTKSLDEVLHDSMIPYTEHVVMDRAIPRVEDGLKPGQRRILYSMMELGLSPDKPYRKSARIVGDCMGKYHPHGDSSVYDAMVRMAQKFSLNETLVDGHGNFGSMDGDSAAAMRYTEARLTPLAMEMLRDLEKNTVRWSFNFDDTLKEPDMLPSRFPNLLVNGTSGIAVGVATNIPPHNLSEVINGVVAYIDNNKITLDEMMKYIKAPDFPTGGILITGDELKQAYETGKGKIIIRAKTEIETNGDKKNIVITELPYQVNKASLLQKIAELKENNKEKLSAISEIRDESDRSGVRCVIRVKKEGNVNAILEFLYKNTSLQTSVPINMVAIADGKPKLLGLIDIISHYVEYQRLVIYRRTKFELDEAKDRAHIVQGLLIAIKNIDEVVKIIKTSANTTMARQRLRERFALSERQAQAILDMRLARLVNLETTKLEQELRELEAKIERLTAIYNSKTLQYKLVKSEILEIKKQFGSPRKSSIVGFEDIEEYDDSDDGLAQAKDVMVAITAEGNVKRIPMKNYSMSQKTIGDSSSLNEIHTTLMSVKTNEKVLIFTNLGNCLKIDVEKLPECKWKEKSTPLMALDKNLQMDERAVAIYPLIEEKEDAKLIFYTSSGMVKLSLLSDYLIAKNCFQAIKLKDDELINVEHFVEDGSIIMASQNGMALRFDKNDIPVQGRVSSGVKGINIADDDKIIFAGQLGKIGAITVVTDAGFAKKVPIGEYEISPRYRKGLRLLTFKDNGKVIKFVMATADPPALVLDDGKKKKLLESKFVPYDNRVAKGKEIVKMKIKNVYIYRD